MKVLISGGTGLIGSALTRSFIRKNDQVTLITRTPENNPMDLTTIPWDLGMISQEMESADVVINLAGASIAGSNPLSMRWTKKRKSQIETSRIMAGEMLLAAIRKSTQKPEVLIQASAIGYYGNTGIQAADESTSPGNDFLAQVCKSWENSTSSVEELGVRRIITRLGLVLSSDGGLLPLLALPFRFYLGGPLGDGLQPMSWIHIEDVVKSYQYFANDSRTQGIYNLTAPIPVSNQTFSTSLGKTLKRPSWLAIPTGAVKLLLGEASTLAVDGREVFPQRLIESGYNFKFKNIDSALFDIFH